jgi:colanic acid/amylovoran biosynthesis protein
VVMYAQTMGPFRLKFRRCLSRWALNRVSLITLREGVSKDYLEELGVNKPPIYVTADPAFLFQAAPTKRVEEIFLKEGIIMTRPLIGLTWGGVGMRKPSNKRAQFLKNIIEPTYAFVRWLLPEQIFESLFGFLGKGALSRGIGEEYYQPATLGEIINYLTEELKATVIVVPHTSTPRVVGNELILSKRLQPFLKRKEKVRFINAHHTAEEIKGIIGQCDLFVSAKMHASIAALSQCVPTVLIPYSHKFYAAVGLLKQEKLMCDNTKIDDLVAKINEVWAHRDEVRRELESKVEIARDKALLNAELVKVLLEKS